MQYAKLYQRDIQQTIDWWLIICYLLLILIGWINIYASCHATESGSILAFASRSGKQFVWILSGLGLAAMILFLFNPRLWEVISIPSYILVLVLLVSVIFVGADIKGSHSWFSLGPVSFQPAEISKITTALVLSSLMSRQDFNLTRTKDFLMAFFIIALPMLTIVAEQETGSALVYLGFIFVLYREGLPGWFLVCVGIVILLFILTLTVSSYVSILVMIALVSFCYEILNGQLKRWLSVSIPAITLAAFLPGLLSSTLLKNTFLSSINPLWIVLGVSILSLPFKAVKAFKKKRLSSWVSIAAFITGVIVVLSTQFVFEKVLQEHQRSRIEVLLGMKDDPSGVGYNVNQSMIAIGSGGFTGKGFLQGTQTTFGFVPEQSTDFIFCTVGEEWGFLGCLLVIFLYCLLIWRIVTDAEECREAFSRIYGYSVASIIFMHLFINVGMTIGLVPVIGIPLPLLSYGGSSLWSFTIMIFIFIALYRQERKFF